MRVSFKGSDSLALLKGQQSNRPFIAQYHPNLTEKWHQDYRMIISPWWASEDPYFLFTPEQRNGHTAVQLNTPRDQPLRTTPCSGSDFLGNSPLFLISGIYSQVTAIVSDPDSNHQLFHWRLRYLPLSGDPVEQTIWHSILQRLGFIHCDHLGSTTAKQHIPLFLPNSSPLFDHLGQIFNALNEAVPNLRQPL